MSRERTLGQNRQVAVLVLLVSVIGFVVALAGAVAGLGSIGLWRWAERRREPSSLGQAAGLIGGTTLLAWFALLFYALSQDTP